MIREGKTVKPDSRKGLIYLQKNDDDLLQFCWKDRETGVVEEELISMYY